MKPKLRRWHVTVSKDWSWSWQRTCCGCLHIEVGPLLIERLVGDCYLYQHESGSSALPEGCGFRQTFDHVTEPALRAVLEAHDSGDDVSERDVNYACEVTLNAWYNDSLDLSIAPTTYDKRREYAANIDSFWEHDNGLAMDAVCNYWKV